jgi:heterodisulfide reductase subunit C
MFYTYTLYIALIVFGIGLIYKISTWFRYQLGTEAANFSVSDRVYAVIRGWIEMLYEWKIPALVQGFVLDVLLNRRILKQDWLRWVMHMCLYWGFVMLLLFHALESIISYKYLPNYASTVNPYMFLRDFFGALVIIGIGIAIYRRFFLKVPRLSTNTQDRYAIIILAVIMVSGVLLEGTKITSYTIYEEMVEEYAADTDEEEREALEAYWVANYDVVSPHAKGPFEAELLEAGAEINEFSCVECHSRPGSAFLGFIVAKITKPFALFLDTVNAPTLLWYIHFLACWIGLAYLPFSKMFHIFASSVSLMTKAVMDEHSDPANIATRQIMELDACTHCGTCSLNCSVAPALASFPNQNILPSEKLEVVKALAQEQDLSADELQQLQEGVYLCTNCRRCTVVCPVGINLQEMWFNVREFLLAKDRPEYLALSPFSFVRGLMQPQVAPGDQATPPQTAKETISDRCTLMKDKDATLPLLATGKEFKEGLRQSSQAQTFAMCFGCETCTTACPVVANFDNPQEALGLVPHQIMHACGMGMRDLAYGSSMLWDCLTCYQCQEQCPQGVSVTDVLYELKNEAIQHVKASA